MRLYRTGLWCHDDRHPIKPFAARGWHVRARGGSFTGTDEELNEFQARRRTRLGLTPTVINPPRGPGRKTFTVSDEVLVLAPNRLAAQRAVNLIAACLSALAGVAVLEPDDLIALPQDGSDLEDLETFGHDVPHRVQYGSPAVGTASIMACRASRRRDRQYALFKLQQSYRNFSVEPVEYHPSYSPRQFGVERDPSRHVRFASAITLAYSSIEELQLEIRASQKRPTLLPPR